MADVKEQNEKIMQEYEKSQQEAKEIIEDPQKAEEKLNEAFEKVNKINNGPISKFIKDITLMIEIVKAWIKGEYKQIPFGSIIAIFGAIIYLVSPFDIIPDFIPGIGHIDDAFVIALVLKQVDADLQDFSNWKQSKTPR